MGLPQLYYAREKLKAQKPFEGKRIGWSKRDNKMESDASWNKRKNTGWQMEKGRWVQYRGGKPTGRTEKYRIDTNFATGTLANVGRVGKAVVDTTATLAGFGPNVLKGTSLNRQNLKYKQAYKTLDEEKGKFEYPRPKGKNKSQLFVTSSGQELDASKLSNKWGADFSVDKKGQLRVRTKREIDAYNAKVAAEEEKARLDSRSFEEKLSTSFSKPSDLESFTDQFNK